MPFPDARGAVGGIRDRQDELLKGDRSQALLRAASYLVAATPQDQDALSGGIPRILQLSAVSEHVFNLAAFAAVEDGHAADLVRTQPLPE